jgi:hypothetical protein
MREPTPDLWNRLNSVAKANFILFRSRHPKPHVLLSFRALGVINIVYKGVRKQ